MFESCLKKQNQVKALFSHCTSEEQKYGVIIDLGKQQSHLDNEEKIPANLVSGCQSQVYLISKLEDGTVTYKAESDALISAGLAKLLIDAYSGESPEVILKCPPQYLEEIGLSNSLSLNRANGLYSIHLRMKQDALKLLLQGK
ncbi:MAG: SufE family protein [Parachlamydiaceae bacterium]|nr:SufE family protein [Parachlamydiaceae bacterium]